MRKNRVIEQNRCYHLVCRLAHRAFFLDSSGGWKLEKNKVTGHCRIIDPDKLRKAWGRESEMRSAFEKVKQQLK